EKERMARHHENRRANGEDAPTRYEFDFVDCAGQTHRVFLNIDVIPGTKTAVASLVDVTDLREAQERLQALTGELEDRVRERTAQLRAANEELEAFAYSVSHDLRAPLRSIDGFSQAVVEDYADRLDETGKDYLRRVRRASQRMGELIDDLLQLSRITRAEFQPDRVDLSALAREVVEELRNAEPERSVEIVIEPDMTADVDRRLMKTALTNLLGNAWKYTSKSEEARIEFTSKTDTTGEVVYTVSDNGAGFDMAYADKLFQPFQRLHRSDEFPGTGIGLASVRRVISRHGGEVWGEGAVDQGASFSFTLSDLPGGEDDG
ncbi:MAG: sensor histidine kinase, partial [Armatimonadota bacterium]